MKRCEPILYGDNDGRIERHFDIALYEWAFKRKLGKISGSYSFWLKFLALTDTDEVLWGFSQIPLLSIDAA